MNQIDSAIAANRFGLGARPGDLARTVFPDSANVKPLRGLVAAANTQ
jgi:hypothetical protein